MTFWNEIYSHFEPVAFSVFGFKIHWYGLMYVLALLVGFWTAKFFIKKDKLNFSDELIENYFVWVEIGVILGARVGYILIYSQNSMFYILRPWEIFNPFINCKFVGISGMSYHGAVIGFILATFLFCKKYKNINLWSLLDLVAICVPVGYIFGRIGNFLNQELIGKETNVEWGILVNGILRHPSQLYEAFLEGFVIFIILFIYRRFKKFDGELIAIYAILYSLMRFISEIFRAPDPQMGIYFLNLQMGQILSILMLFFGIFIYFLKFKK